MLRAECLCPAQLEFAEDRKPPHSRHAVELLLLSRSPGLAQRSGNARGARRAKRICRLGKNSWMLPASKGLNYLSRMALGSTGTLACALFAAYTFRCTAKSGCATKARRRQFNGARAKDCSSK